MPQKDILVLNIRSKPEKDKRVLVHVCVYARVCVYLCVCRRVHVCVYARVCVYLCVCRRVHSWILFRRTKSPDVTYFFSPVPAYILLLSTTPEKEGFKMTFLSIYIIKKAFPVFPAYSLVCHMRKQSQTLWMHRFRTPMHTQGPNNRYELPSGVHI